MCCYIRSTPLSRRPPDAPSLTLRASPGQGMHVHLSRKRDQTKLSNDPNFVAIYESGSTKCFFNLVCFAFHFLHEDS